MTPSNAPRRGDVYWTELDPAQGAEMQKTRPCLVITTDFINRRRRTVVVIPLSTTAPKEFPLYVPMPSVGGNSQAVMDQIRVVDKGRVGDWIVRASEAEMEDVAVAMKMVFAIV